MEMGDLTWRGLILVAMIFVVGWYLYRISGNLERQITALKARVQRLEEKMQDDEWLDEDE
jgi:hypothetical protein